MHKTPKAILFDLDGTLLDTAPDLAAALNHVRKIENLSPLSLTEIRPVCSDGARGLLQLGLQIDESNAKFTSFRSILLEYYATYIAEYTALFKGMAELLTLLEEKSIPWGIVTNKPAALTNKLISKLQLDSRAACVISGDTLPQRKPHPAPLLHAVSLINLSPETCWYVGDAERDIQAGKNAGMFTIAATYGYIHQDDDPVRWNADKLIHSPHDLMKMLNYP